MYLHNLSSLFNCNILIHFEETPNFDRSRSVKTCCATNYGLERGVTNVLNASTYNLTKYCGQHDCLDMFPPQKENLNRTDSRSTQGFRQHPNSRIYHVTSICIYNSTGTCVVLVGFQWCPFSYWLNQTKIMNLVSRNANVRRFVLLLSRIFQQARLLMEMTRK